ncbi:MAG: hypothetical protein IJB61_02355 [Bacteroides sp]|nr:hypothetical protein [Bacteroides sp.]
MKDVRNYFNILMVLLCFGVAASCTHDDGLNDINNQKNVTLTLSLGQEVSGEARGDITTENGKDELNENKMETVDLFFYHATATPEENAIFSKSIELPDNTQTSATINFEMPVDKFKELFPTDGDTECQVYAIVNRPNEDESRLPQDNDFSLASLKDEIFLSAPGFKNGPSMQEIFVMDGLTKITRTNSSLTGNIPVERVAAKISMIIDEITTVEQNVNGNTVEWVPVPGSVKISLRRGSMRTKLGSTPEEYIYQPNNEDLFTIEDVSLVDDRTTDYPFYTYPTNWKNNENSRTHFIITVGWKKNGEGNTILTYYEVNVNNMGSYTQRNRHYKITQEISILGSTEKDTPVVLYPSSYIVLPWGNAHTVGDSSSNTDSEGNLSRFHYLVVDETNVEMDNVSSKQIYFFSSDPVDLSSVDVKWDYTAQETSGILTFATLDNASRSVNQETGDITYEISNETDVEVNVNETTIVVPNRIKENYKVTIRIHNADENEVNDQSYIYVEHPLNNNMSSNADYTSYFINLVIQHKDDNTYNETINITQHPMIRIKADPNSVPNGNGGVWVNNGTSYYGGVHGLGGSNKNPNRYIISVSALDTGSEYIIGDPREPTVNNLSTNFANALTMRYEGDTQNRRLKYYHRTDETSKTSAMISPQFMIASSYGVTSDVSKANARRRCATYQEDGYPAGRWRLPTQAEIQYIVQLSAWKVIPTLFGTTDSDTEAKYWGANGAVIVKAKSGTVTSTTDTDDGPVRCVYDTWYWTDKCNKNTFTWGDKSTF